MHYIAMDTHIATLEFAIVNERGELKRCEKIPTSAKGLIEFIKSIPKPRTLYIEEGSLAAWVVDTCRSFGEKIIVTDPKRNRWIGRSEDKNDPMDARKLAHLARGGYVKEIPHAVGQRRRFRELVQYYHDQIKSQTRIKNKIKSKFRQNGIPCTGETVYSKKHQPQWLKKLPPNNVVHFMVQRLWSQLESIERCIKDTIKEINRFKKIYPEITWFRKIPGIGPIHSATVSAILEDPHRFASRKKVWKYAGLGIMKKSSSHVVYYEKLTSQYNRLLKYTLLQAVQAAIKAKPNPFRRQYDHLTLIKKTHPNRAKLTVARSLLTTMWIIWKKGVPYDPKIKEVHKTS